jgi:hypothetical protein
MPNPTIPIHLYAIKNYICQMDIEMLDAFLDDNRRYQLHTKSEYLQKLAVVFENFKTNGDTHLIPYEGRCNNCDPRKTGYTFVGNQSGNYVNIIFIIGGGELINFDECSDLNIKRPDVILKNKIELGTTMYGFNE